MSAQHRLADPTIAVMGLNATDDPGPGVGVIRALRDAPEFRGRIVGLAYDALEPGHTRETSSTTSSPIFYGAEALEARRRHIHDRTPLDVVIPTLDSELGPRSPSRSPLAPREPTTSRHRRCGPGGCT